MLLLDVALQLVASVLGVVAVRALVARVSAALQGHVTHQVSPGIVSPSAIHALILLIRCYSSLSDFRLSGRGWYGLCFCQLRWW